MRDGLCCQLATLDDADVSENGFIKMQPPAEAASEQTYCSGMASSLGSLSPWAGRTTLTALLKSVIEHNTNT
jgi:hypothetical protein